MSDSQWSRRDFARLGAAGLGLGLAPGLSAAQQPAAPATGRPEALKSEFLVDMIFETDGKAIGTIGTHTIVSVTGGTFEGPKLKGTVLPPGADYVLAVTPTFRKLDVRTIFLTDDQEKIYVTYGGVLSTPKGGERYWRTTPMFETSAEKYQWLNEIVCVGVPFDVPNRVSYRVFRIL
jgi:Protein of unknown function (DUF3237)